MTIDDLPVGAQPPALAFDHFPTRFQAVIWRNWELVPPAALARVLQADEPAILALAAGLGLRVPPQVNPRWLQRGYVTIIRANWHLLPYAQLLDLLGWTPQRMAFALKEEDFLWGKLGGLKPRAEPVRVRPLTEAERGRTRRIRAAVERLFPDIQAPDGEPPFGFVDSLAAPHAPPAGVAPAPAAAPRFDFTYLYSYSAVYGDPLSDPALDPYPDGLLARLADLGVNAVWLPVLLYKLFPWKFGAYAEGWEQRLAALRKLTGRAARFGLSVLTYFNEPRCMPMAFFRDHPELKGVTDRRGLNGALCTSLPAVQDLLRAGSAWLFREVPRLGGVFTITMSENLTNCHSHSQPEGCPRCSARRPAEVVAEVNRLIAEGVHSVKPDAPVIAWDWGWRADWAPEAIDALPADVGLMCTSECELPTRVGGVPGSVVDYTISQPGPSPRSRALWDRARRRGLKVLAKVQLNNTWECSALPYLPVPDLVEEHLGRLAEAGVRGLMLSWTLGGFPAGNLRQLRETSDQTARRAYGSAAGAVREAWRRFSDAFREFPFHVGVAYNAPHNVGPKNLLYAKPTGYAATMVGDPYDDLDKWRAIYPVDIFEQQFRKLSEGWQRGLEVLRSAAPPGGAAERAEFEDLQRVAASAYCHFRSAFLQIAFVRRRAAGERAALDAILDEEQALALTLHGLARRDSRLGFEATNHYAYTLQDLREKALNCEWLRGS